MSGANKMKGNKEVQCYDWVSISQTAQRRETPKGIQKIYTGV